MEPKAFFLIAQVEGNNPNRDQNPEALESPNNPAATPPTPSGDPQQTNPGSFPPSELPTSGPRNQAPAQTRTGAPPTRIQDQPPSPTTGSDPLLLIFLGIAILISLFNLIYSLWRFTIIDKKVRATSQKIPENLKNLYSQDQINDRNIDSIITEINKIKDSLKQIEPSNSPKTTPSYQEPVYSQQQGYYQQVHLNYVERLVSDYNKDNLSSNYNSIIVGETQDSRKNRDSGSLSPITFSQDASGAFLVFQDEDGRNGSWLLPNPGYKNGSRLSRGGLLALVEKVFVIQGHPASGYNTFQIIRPARVRSIGNGIYELVELGKIQFM